MSPSPIHCDREKLSLAVAEFVRKNGPVRLSDMFMSAWCGHHHPTEELQGWLKSRGLEIMPGLDFHGGYEVKPIGTEGGLFG